jgi:hypothetical protein
MILMYKRLSSLLGNLVFAACLTGGAVAHAQTHGTAVIILATRDSIVVAADSKVTVSTVDGKDSAVTFGPGPRALHPCKILKVDDSTFVAIQGYRSTAETTMTDARGRITQSQGNHADFLREVRDAMQKESGSMMDRFSKALQPLANFRFSEKTLQEARIGKSNEPVVLMQFVCFGREAGQLTLLQWRKSDTSLQGPWAIELPPRQMQLGILGSVQEKLGPFIQAHPEVTRGKDLVSEARKLMDEAFRLDPSSSGPPVDILRITRSGYEWIQRKQACE